MVGHVVVVGASLAGWRTAEALRREGHRGRITLIGAESELPYDRPPLSKQFLTDDWDDAKLALARDGVEGVGAEWRLGEEAVSLDVATRTITLASGERIEGADAVVIATGARARRLPFGHDLEGVLELRTQADARALRNALASAPRVVVVGAGFIGMELAASCRARGLEVDVVDPLPAPLVRGLGPVLGRRVAERHRREGVRFHLEVGVEGFEGEGRVTGVRLTDGTRLAADLVLVGIGAAPATAWLEGSGLELDDGVCCDANGFTGHEGIYAVGDCARWANVHYPDRPRFEHWTSAVEQADVVARRIIAGEPVEHAPIPYVWTDQFDLRIAIVGEVREGDDMHVCLGRLEDDRFLALFGRDDRLVAAVGFKRPRQLNACRRRIAEGVGFREAIAEFDETAGADRAAAGPAGGAASPG
jgi:NADPH-dependent 2,4-dienoyl-CoA reductase/sulfur reductase-like enzyme